MFIRAGNTEPRSRRIYARAAELIRKLGGRRAR